MTTEAEMLAGLVPNRVIEVAGPAKDNPTAKGSGNAVLRRVPVVVFGAANTRQLIQFDYIVMNRGAGPAGPRTYSADVYDEDGTTLLHSAGDPVLDENGDQVVVSPQDAERVHEITKLEMPVAETYTALTYLEARKDAGEWFHYVEDKTEEKRPDMKSAVIRVFVAHDPDPATEHKIIVAEDSNGVPFHKYLS